MIESVGPKESAPETSKEGREAERAPMGENDSGGDGETNYATADLGEFSMPESSSEERASYQSEFAPPEPAETESPAESIKFDDAGDGSAEATPTEKTDEDSGSRAESESPAESVKDRSESGG